MSTRATWRAHAGELRVLRTLLAALLCTVMAGCGDGNNNREFRVGQLRVINAVSDSPALTVLVANTTLGVLAYGQSTNLQVVATGRQRVDIRFAPPGAAAADLIANSQVSISENRQTTMVVTGSMAAASAVLVQEVLPDVAAGQSEAHFFNASTAGIDVYLTAPGADLTSISPTASVAAAAASGLTTRAAGTYQLRVTATGNKTVIHDAGNVELRALGRRLFVAVRHFGAAGEPLRIVSVDALSSSSPTAEVLSSRIRVGHVVADVAAVDVYLGAATGVPAFAGVATNTFSSYRVLPAGSSLVTATVSGDPATILFSSTVMRVPGDSSTLSLTGQLSTNTVRQQLFPDLVRPVANQGSVQLLHGAPGGTPVRVFLVASGGAIAAVEPVFSSLSYLTRADFALATGNFDVVVTDLEATPMELVRSPLTVAAGGIYQLVLSDAPGGGTPIQLQLAEQITP